MKLVGARCCRRMTRKKDEEEESGSKVKSHNLPTPSTPFKVHLLPAVVVLKRGRSLMWHLGANNLHWGEGPPQQLSAYLPATSVCAYLLLPLLRVWRM